MGNSYAFAQIIHLICAIIFIGYLFFDVVIFSRAKKLLDEDLAKKAEESIGKKAIKIMPICLLMLLLTGGFMMKNWVNSNIGFFDSNLQIVFMIKVFCASLIFLAVIFSLSCKFVFKCKNPLGKIIHPLALSLATIIVLCAKLMFYV